LEVTSKSPRDEDSAIPQPGSVSEPHKPPTARRLEQSRAESETENLCSEETKLDQAVGKTTATDPGITDRLLAKIDRPEHQQNEASPVHVEQADDGSLVWSGEAQEGEQALIADFQALVDAGVGEWRENDAEGEL
jgi:hypothetical protein